jgi:hypothetical protein
MTRFKKFTIYPVFKERYAEVKAVLIENGYSLCCEEVIPDGNKITTCERGYYKTHVNNSLCKGIIYTVDEFLSKYGSLTKPLTIGEIHQFRELLKAHSPTTGQPEPKPETYEGVFYFSHHDSRPMCGLNDGYLYFHTVLKRWIVGAMNPETKTHTLIEAPHEVGQFYLLAEGFDPKDPTNYGLYDGERFWNWTLSGCILKEASATNLKVVKA